MPPKKKVPAGEKKKTKTASPAVKSAKKTAPAPPPRPAPVVQSSGGKSPVYVLTIMALLAVMAFAGERFYDKIFKNSGQKSDQKKVETKAPLKKKEAQIASEESVTEKEIVKSVKLFLLNYNEKTERVELSAVVRKVEGDDFIEKTMHALMKGPTGSEKGKGLLTAIESDTKIKNISLRKKILEIDFNSAVSRGAGGGIILNRIDQIVYTATQFSEVDAVVIKINGKTATTLGSDGVSISGPLRRRR